MELVAIGAMGHWGWQMNHAPWKYILVIGLPLTAMIVWGTFNVPEDPSRSGKAPVKVPGWVRLFIEAVVFTTGGLCLHASGYPEYALIYAAILAVHYAISYDRIAWLLK